MTYDHVHTPDPFDTPLFNRLVGLIEEQNNAVKEQKKVMAEQYQEMKDIKKTLKFHGEQFDVLTRDALKNDQPYDQKSLEDESTCTALFEMAMAKTKEEVDEWIKRMDVSLFFIALFSAVLSAFIVPATQNLFPDSNNYPENTSDSSSPVPATSAQNICVVYYLAMILALLNAVLSVLGRQWMSRLTLKPSGATYRERLLRHLDREKLAKWWLKYLVEGLHMLLLWSIGLFMTGLLYQLRIIATSFDGEAPRLMATWRLGVTISSVMLLTILAATMHALRYEASPFGGPFSRLILKLTEIIHYILHTVLVEVKYLKVLMERLILLNLLAGRGIIEAIFFFISCTGLFAPLWLPFFLIRRWRVKVDTEDPGKLINAYMELIADANDPRLLERAIASFSYADWVKYGGGCVGKLGKAYTRLMATDTSIRVQETLSARLSEFVIECRERSSTIGGNWSKKLIDFFSSRLPSSFDFPTQVLFTSFGEGNDDLRALASLPYEECIARVMCTFDTGGKLGDRTRIFDVAQEHCYQLLKTGKERELIRVLSNVKPLSLMRSYIQFPGNLSAASEALINFVLRGSRTEIQREVSRFVKNTSNRSILNSRSLSSVFIMIATPTPTDVDLSPLIDYVSRHHHRQTWRQFSDIAIGYLEAYGLSNIYDHTGVRRFLQQCVNTRFRDRSLNLYDTSDETRFQAQVLLKELDSLPIIPSPPPVALRTSDQNASDDGSTQSLTGTSSHQAKFGSLSKGPDSDIQLPESSPQLEAARSNMRKNESDS
ncbi:hypothetical protein SISNIDRAFT_489658 [Sistotremastrum niveocremeum HHB9708]|uniref:DUF6535 domain-containing protein n=1 Tax=Sistotremastrum niveocremeum HHB9708 TaxID=1314777 RepID=A0A164PSM3_9AGAM|nr:hypothetical protein SISNIDRAFT_489658 [Sistotremastrum niveocremeum HHB9708]